MVVLPRQFVNNNNDDICVDQYGNEYYCRSGWYNWGRWVLLGAIVLAAFLFFFLFSRYTARRRRRMGARPMYGTGWATAPFGHGAATYNPNYRNQQQSGQQGGPPNYQQGGYYGQNQGYFGGQQTGTELREPENVYRGGDTVYTPPTGPPPKKQNDGIVR